MAYFGDHPESIRRNENMGDEELEDLKTGPLHALRDSLGNITADYMGDFQRVMYGDDASSDHFPVKGVPAVFEDSGQVQRFLVEVGQDPDAYASITSAQQAYTSMMVHEVVNGESRSTVALEQRISNAVAPGAVIAGIMSEARADATIDAIDEIVGRALLNHSGTNSDTALDIREAATTQAGNSYGEGSMREASGDAS
ncbi:hypothetical protein [Streptomyces macrosporus]|uniref:Uncharacterized protein n=1 Tax=Streptomyces macrosporus TaxID=44032 RepID=A0ABP5X9G4_9ACTN